MKYIAHKLFTSLVTLVLVSLMILLVFQVLPGNPARVILGVEADENQIAALEKEMGLDRPLFVRYLDWIGGLLRGKMGKSIKYNMPVESLLKARFPVTLFLTVYSLFITVLIGVPLGVWIASRDGKWYSMLLSVSTQLGISVPAFWLGFLLINFQCELTGFPPSVSM